MKNVLADAKIAPLTVYDIKGSRDPGRFTEPHKPGVLKDLNFLDNGCKVFGNTIKVFLQN
jgi:hypothetical protein